MIKKGIPWLKNQKSISKNARTGEFIMKADVTSNLGLSDAHFVGE
jgi:hypothetical protein